MNILTIRIGEENSTPLTAEEIAKKQALGQEFNMTVKAIQAHHPTINVHQEIGRRLDAMYVHEDIWGTEHTEVCCMVAKGLLAEIEMA